MARLTSTERHLAKCRRQVPTVVWFVVLLSMTSFSRSFSLVDANSLQLVIGSSSENSSLIPADVWTRSLVEELSGWILSVTHRGIKSGSAEWSPSIRRRNQESSEHPVRQRLPNTEDEENFEGFAPIDAGSNEPIVVPGNASLTVQQDEILKDANGVSTTNESENGADEATPHTRAHGTRQARDFYEFIAFVCWYLFLIVCCIVPTICIYRQRLRRERRMLREMEESVAARQRQITELAFLSVGTSSSHHHHQTEEWKKERKLLLQKQWEKTTLSVTEEIFTGFTGSKDQGSAAHETVEQPGGELDKDLHVVKANEEEDETIDKTNEVCIDIIDDKACEFKSDERPDERCMSTEADVGDKCDNGKSAKSDSFDGNSSEQPNEIPDEIRGEIRGEISGEISGEILETVCNMSADKDEEDCELVLQGDDSVCEKESNSSLKEDIPMTDILNERDSTNASCNGSNAQQKDVEQKDVGGEESLTESDLLHLPEYNPETKEKFANGGPRDIPNSCAICLSPYEPGCNVIWSSNKCCPHAFHESCITMWCMKKIEEDPRTLSCLCPCCRQEFVFLESSPRPGIGHEDDNSDQEPGNVLSDDRGRTEDNNSESEAEGESRPRWSQQPSLFIYLNL